MTTGPTSTQLTFDVVDGPRPRDPDPEPIVEPQPVLDPETDVDPGREPISVEVIRSARRRKTVEARLIGDTLEIRMPMSLDAAEEQRFVAHFRAAFERKRSSSRIDLSARADRLATELGLSHPRSIRWVGNQHRRWGSCTPVDGSVRISDRLADCPPWVLDYVIVHELAHLDVADHGPRFQALVARYPRAERAIGFLIARGWDGH